MTNHVDLTTNKIVKKQPIPAHRLRLERYKFMIYHMDEIHAAGFEMDMNYESGTYDANCVIRAEKRRFDELYHAERRTVANTLADLWGIRWDDRLNGMIPEYGVFDNCVTMEERYDNRPEEAFFNIRYNDVAQVRRAPRQYYVFG